MLVVVSAVGLPAQTLASEKAVVTIGRAPDNDFVLPYEAVAPHHVRVEGSKDRDAPFRVTDLGASSEGTWVVGEKIVATVAEAPPGENVVIGPYTLAFYHDDVRTLPPPDVSSREPSYSEPRASAFASDETERAFLDAIERDPSDDAARTVYADWLEEKSRPREAEFVRVQLALKSLAAEDPTFQPKSERLRELAMFVSNAWRTALARPVIENCDLRYELVCPRSWDALAPTETPSVRFCAGCSKTVHFARTVQEAREHAAAGRCVAVDVVLVRTPNDLDPPSDRRPMLAGVIAPPSSWSPHDTAPPTGRT